MMYTIVLNTHIPRSGLPWAYEALFHCYLPLFSKIRNIPLAMAFSPQLILEFTSPDFPRKCVDFYNSEHSKAVQIGDQALSKYYQDYYTEQMDLLQSVQFDVSRLWSDTAWEFLAYPSTHCVLPLVTQKLVQHFLDEGEKVLKSYFGVSGFRGVWLPEMAFEDGVNNLRSILAEKYEYVLGNWKTVEGVGDTNRLYIDSSGLRVVVRNDRLQPLIWGQQSRISSMPDFRETFRFDQVGNKIFRVGGGIYFPGDAQESLNRSLALLQAPLREEVGDYTALMFDTEYFGHHWWEGKDFLPRLLESIRQDLVLPRDLLGACAPRALELRGQSYTWGSNGFGNGNGTLDTWVCGKNHRHLQLYRDLMIHIADWDEEKMQAHGELLRTFFSSDWLFIISGDQKDISNARVPVPKIASELLFSVFQELMSR